MCIIVIVIDVRRPTRTPHPTTVSRVVLWDAFGLAESTLSAHSDAQPARAESGDGMEVLGTLGGTGATLCRPSPLQTHMLHARTRVAHARPRHTRGVAAVAARARHLETSESVEDTDSAGGR